MNFLSFFRGWWGDNSELMFRIRGTVILKIWSQILFVLVYSSAVVFAHTFVPEMEITVPQTLVPILGLVIGLLLVFRTNTAYDRYYEGRRIWSMMTHNIRVLTRCFWLGVRETGSAKELIEKTTAINLLVCFAYATKNYLREEYSINDDDELRELISHVPIFNQNQQKQFPTTDTKDKKRHPVPQNQQIILDPNNKGSNNPREVIINVDVAESPNNSVKSNASSKKLSRPITMSTRRKCALATREATSESFTRRDNIYQAHDYVKPTNIPLQLAYYIDSYTYLAQSRKALENETFKVMLASVNSLIDSLTQFERILRTPIPLAYSVHLHHSIWLYLLSLPFQLMGKLGWAAVPIIGFAAFALLGILAIGWEIENPFGYDDNDLPLDDFCEVIKKEVQMIMSHEIPKPESWTFSQENHPFIPKSRESALELNERSVEQLREMLAKGSEYEFWNAGFKP